MISRLRLGRIPLALSHRDALVLLREIARDHGFEITDTMDVEAYVRERTGQALNHETTLIQMQKPAMVLGSALLEDALPLVLPFRMVVRELRDRVCVLYFPEWEAVPDRDNTHAQHCLTVLYTEIVSKVASAIERSLPRAEVAFPVHPLNG